MAGGLGRVTNHPDYYLMDGSVSFLTGGVLFRPHIFFFVRESEVFRDLFATAAQDDPQIGSDARPFTLDVTPDEFAQLLWVWYDRDYSYRQQTKDNWVIILRLATRWAFNKVKELALRELESLELPPAERIFIYNEHGIDGERLLSSYVDLCKSPTVPTEADARLLQMETLINILQARENAQHKAGEMGHESPTSACLEDEALREIVLKLFKKGLSPRSSGTSTGSGDQAPDLNGELAHKPTITVGEPQVPDRRAQTASTPSHLTGNDGKGSQEKEQGNDAREKVKREDERKLAKAKQDKEKKEKEEREEQEREAKENADREKREKAKQDKEKEEREAKEKAEREKAEKARQDKEKQDKEKEQKVPAWLKPANSRRY